MCRREDGREGGREREERREREEKEREEERGSLMSALSSLKLSWSPYTLRREGGERERGREEEERREREERERTGEREEREREKERMGEREERREGGERGREREERREKEPDVFTRIILEPIHTACTYYSHKYKYFPLPPCPGFSWIGRIIYRLAAASSIVLWSCIVFKNHKKID